MCKTLCNELLEFEEKVCHIELAANQTSEKLLKEVLKKLTSATEEVLHDLNEGEVTTSHLMQVAIFSLMRFNGMLE